MSLSSDDTHCMVNGHHNNSASACDDHLPTVLLVEGWDGRRSVCVQTQFPKNPDIQNAFAHK